MTEVYLTQLYNLLTSQDRSSGANSVSFAPGWKVDHHSIAHTSQSTHKSSVGSLMAVEVVCGRAVMVKFGFRVCRQTGLRNPVVDERNGAFRRARLRIEARLTGCPLNPSFWWIDLGIHEAGHFSSEAVTSRSTRVKLA